MSGARGTVGIVLAGGRSSRLAGADLPPGGKPAIVHEGRTFLERVVSVVAAETDRVFVVATPGQRLPALSAAVEVVHDSRPGSGPLAGIRDALAAATRLAPRPDVAIVCAGDVPLVRREVLRLLIARSLGTGAAWVVPVHDGHPQVLLSAITVGLLPRIEAYLAAGRRDVRGLLAAVEAEARVERIMPATLATVDPDGSSWVDIDTPADLERLRRRGIPPSAP